MHEIDICPVHDRDIGRVLQLTSVSDPRWQGTQQPMRCCKVLPTVPDAVLAEPPVCGQVLVQRRVREGEE